MDVEKIHETYTNDDAGRDVLAKTYLSRMYKDIDEAKKPIVIKELKDIISPLGRATFELMKNPDFIKEMKDLSSKVTPLTAEYNKQSDELKAKYSPVFAQAHNNLRDLERKHNLSLKEEHTASSEVDNDQKKKISQEMTSAYLKNLSTHEQWMALLDNPDYQHEAQLVAEKYNNTQDSAEYLNEMNNLTYKYCPEYKQVREEYKYVIEKNKKS